MLEALVSFTLLAVVGAASVTASVNVTSTSNNSGNRVAAANLAQQDQQAAQALRYPTYPAAIAARSVVVGSTTYTVTRTVTGSCPLPPNYDTNPYMTVKSIVTWPPASTARTVTMAQELAC
ncbi:hypothetical protein [uncultured Jatrophihabitans sp.]|uniref:hypothetical protein n=1 Tax=uncultured Jatrophihabitans sp. TaxID=1610747 RepID=UPI0035CAD569